jgi:hypothetical protein
MVNIDYRNDLLKSFFKRNMTVFPRQVHLSASQKFGFGVIFGVTFLSAKLKKKFVKKNLAGKWFDSR